MGRMKNIIGEKTIYECSLISLNIYAHDKPKTYLDEMAKKLFSFMSNFLNGKNEHVINIYIIDSPTISENSYYYDSRSNELHIKVIDTEELDEIIIYAVGAITNCLKTDGAVNINIPSQVTEFKLSLFETTVEGELVISIADNIIDAVEKVIVNQEFYHKDGIRLLVSNPSDYKVNLIRRNDITNPSFSITGASIKVINLMVSYKLTPLEIADNISAIFKSISNS